MSLDGTCEELSENQVCSDGLNKFEPEKLEYVGSSAIIPAEWVDYAKNPTIVLQDELGRGIVPVLEKGGQFEKHIFKLDSEGSRAFFAFERYVGKYWVQWILLVSNVDTSLLDPNSIIRSSNPRSFGTQKWAEVRIEDLLKIWKEDRNLCVVDEHETTESMSMRPPSVAADYHTRAQSLNQQQPMDPKAYLQKKYYETLFSLRIPIAYFVKSSLARTKNMSKGISLNGNISYQMHLADLLLEIPTFDQRHESGPNGLLNCLLSTEEMTIIRQNYLNQFHGLNTPEASDLLGDLLLILKVREIKLQILILLELIALNNMDSKLIDFDNAYKSKLKRRAKGVARSAKNFKSKRNDRKVGAASSSLDFCEKLDIYIDKLCIIDIMLLTSGIGTRSFPAKADDDDSSSSRIAEYKKSLLSPGKETSTSGFVTYVLVPYYTRRTPHAVDFISKKIKGPRFNSFSRPAKNKVPAVLESSGTPDIPIRNDPPSSPPSETSSVQNPTDVVNERSYALQTTKKVKRVFMPHRPPSLNARSDSQLSEFLELESSFSKKVPSATRANSDMFLSKLQRRQLPVTELVTHSVTDLMKPNTLVTRPPSTTRASSNGMFQRIGRRKVDPKQMAKASENPMRVQVEATPRGKIDTSTFLPRFDSTIIESPLIEANAPEESTRATIHQATMTFDTPSRTGVAHDGHLQVPASTVKASDEPSQLVHSPDVRKVKRVRRRLFAPQ